jgi:hypothetical protein
MFFLSSAVSGLLHYAAADLDGHPRFDIRNPVRGDDLSRAPRI